MARRCWGAHRCRGEDTTSCDAAVSVAGAARRFRDASTTRADEPESPDTIRPAADVECAGADTELAWRLLDALHRDPAAVRGHHFPSAISLSVALPSSASADSFAVTDG